jgi:hypothetical protein
MSAPYSTGQASPTNNNSTMMFDCRKALPVKAGKTADLRKIGPEDN